MKILIIAALVYCILLFLSWIERKPKQTNRRSCTQSTYEPTDLNTEYETSQYRIMKSTYLKSAKWKTKRSRILARDNHRCVLCGSTSNLHVHHRSYKRLYEEQDSDLTTLCSTCHTARHNKLGFPQTIQEYILFYDDLK